MKYIAFAVGLAAVLMFLLSYQQKKRKNIIFMNILSRVLYVLQYALLGAFEGAAFDAAGILSSWLAQKKDSGVVKRHTVLFIALSNAVIIGLGAVMYRDVLSLLPVAGVLFETVALWISREKHIRIVSLAAQPFWIAYNLIYGAYASAIGNACAIASVVIAMLRYDVGLCRNKEN